MAAPVITSPVSGSTITFAPGESKDILVSAFDPDNGAPVSATFKVTDLQGNIVPVNVKLQLQDSLTYSADPAPAGWIVRQDSVNKALFHVTAP